jgi:hypothetical protein
MNGMLLCKYPKHGFMPRFVSSRIERQDGQIMFREGTNHGVAFMENGVSFNNSGALACDLPLYNMVKYEIHHRQIKACVAKNCAAY